jgi:transposase
LIPYKRIEESFSDQVGIPLSCASIYNFNEAAFQQLEQFEAIAKMRLISSDRIHVDETGINIDGKRVWLHSASNEQWTCFFAHEKRGKVAMDEMGILPHFSGVLCHDHWKPYFKYTCVHSLCNAHHLRELERAWEQDGQQWAKELQSLLQEIRQLVNESGGCLPTRLSKKYRKRYRDVIERGNMECPPPDENQRTGNRGRLKRTKSRNLLERLMDFEDETLRFMEDPLVPFTNNQGENDIRMTKVQQKISGCFRSIRGAEIFCRVRGYLSTCRKHGLSASKALRLVFEGKLPDFINEN